MSAVEQRKAIGHIDRRGVLLVFPVANRPRPRSLWSELHPRTKMRWEWDSTGDGRVVGLWHLRAELARSGKVVYAKWFRNRATFFSRAVFQAMIGALMASGPLDAGLGPEAREILEILEDSSPQSTKALRKAAGLQGKMLERPWNAALKQLWSRMLIVGFGEVDDGAFPSLAVGATRLLFEDLWLAARDRDEAGRAEDEALLAATLADEPLFAKMFAEARAELSARPGAAGVAP